MLPTNDLQQISELVSPLWRELRGQKVFVSGGTGFVGSWLIESFLFANKAYSLGAELTVLSRNPSRFLDAHPELKSEPALKFITGDVRNFSDPEGDFHLVIHAATEPIVSNDAKMRIQTLDVSYLGTRRVLDFCKNKKVKKCLFVSSGAVYGPQPQELSHIPENFVGSLHSTEPSYAYGEGKRISEWLCIQYGSAFSFEVKIARCFAFVGPYLPLDGHFAVGNFISDVIAGKDISIRGDGLAKRSYMYASDLAVWLWTILLQGKNFESYNVGSEKEISMKQLAERIAAIGNSALKVTVQGENTGNLSGDLYIPSTRKAQTELNLKLTVGVDQAIEKTLNFYKNREVTP